MAQQYYSKNKFPPLTDEEIKQRYKDVQEEMKEVLEWKKESKANLDDPKLSPQKRGAAKRALKKIQRRINNVQGQIIYWQLRIKGESHFKANIEKNEYWASCNEKAKLKGTSEAEKKKKIEAELPNILKGKL